MSKRDDERIAALARKNAAKAAAPRSDRAGKYDDTLQQRQRTESDAETERLFKEMRRREF